MTSFLLNFYLLIGCFAPKADILHEFHLSKCDIDYDKEATALQISLSLFIDDLEGTLANIGHENLHICSEKEASTAEEIIFQYIKNHLLISVDDQDVQLNWVGKEVSEDLAAVWCYLEVSNVTPERVIQVKNDLLMESFDDQQNVVKLQFDNSHKSFFLFNKGEFTGSLEL